MGDKQRFGDGEDCNIIPSAAVTDTTPVVSRIVDMRRYDSVGLQFVTAGAVQGSWKVEVSNDYVPPTNGSVYGSIANAGTWTDITSFFSPAIAPVTAASNQPVQADLTFRSLRVTFTPTSGSGTVNVIGFAKSWS